MTRNDSKDFSLIEQLMAPSFCPQQAPVPEVPDAAAIRAGDDAARVRADHAAIRAWSDELGYRAIRDQEHARQRSLQAELRGINNYGVIDRVQLGWAAGSAVLATAVTVGGIADFSGWSREYRAGYATGAVALAGTAAHTAGRQIERRDRRRIQEDLLQSEFLVRRAHDQWRVSERMAGVGTTSTPPQPGRAVR